MHTLVGPLSQALPAGDASGPVLQLPWADGKVGKYPESLVGLG